MSTIIQIKNISKVYGKTHVLKDVNLEIKKGEIIALLGPNGAGKTTLISIICGLVNKSAGSVIIDGFDNATNFRKAREKVGLVPQELHLAMFDKVVNTLHYSRGLFGKKRNEKHINELIEKLHLSDKKNQEIRSLSGGMKRRVLIAKALAHQPKILFLDEPTAGVDVELRKSTWNLVKQLRQSGVTIILTTHYIEEAESIADRIGIINKGKLILVDDKKTLMKRLGKKHIQINLANPIEEMPQKLKDLSLELSEDKINLYYHFKDKKEYQNIPLILQTIKDCGLNINELNTSKSSLEDIFVDIVNDEY